MIKNLVKVSNYEKKLFALINALIDLMESDAEKKECANMISEISEYSKYFFSIEEKQIFVRGDIIGSHLSWYFGWD